METDGHLLKARILDAASLCERRRQPQFLGFLDEKQKAFCARCAQTAEGVLFWGGYEGAERTVLGVFPTAETDPGVFPVTAVEAVFRREDTLTHRDVLGTLMGLGLRREAVGDILLEPGRAVFFLLSSAASYVLTQLEGIGRSGVRCREYTGEVTPPPKRTEVLRRTAASLRLDGVLSAVLPLSRSNCAAQIIRGMVQLRQEECRKPDALLREGDVFSVRGYGKFRLEEVHGLSKKGRLCVTITRYL